jgi:hypothetical protein
LKSNNQQEIYLLCFKQETKQEGWVEHRNQDNFNHFSQLKLENLKSCTQYKAKVELGFNNEPVKASNEQPIPSIITPDFWTQPNDTILPNLTLINKTEDSAQFELTG